MTPQEKDEINRLIANEVWVSLPGPQTAAVLCDADELFYGGAAGGGKTDMLLGLALTQHYRSIIFRRQGTQLQGIFDRLHTEILKSTDGWNGQHNIQRLSGGRKIEFGSCPNVGDEIKYQGRPHDLICFDEVTHFLESQYRFLSGWLRTTKKGQRCRIVAAGNPPTDSDGEWVIAYWAPWLDKNHPYPAKPGELRWFAMVDGEDTEVPDGNPFEYKGDTIIPKSRTFLPSSVEDNPYLMESGYKSRLQALPEPLRSQMLLGDFSAGKGTDPWQVLPTSWVEAAMDRWGPGAGRNTPMDSVGVDPARGGPDETVIARRHGVWYDELLRYPGKSTPDGPAVASLVVLEMRNGAPIHVDIIGIGSSVYDHLNDANVHVVAVNGAERKSVAKETDKSGKLSFFNMRSKIYWDFRDALDPRNNVGICLPKDSKLKADLCAPRFTLKPGGILIESKEDIIKRLGRSTDSGDAVVYAGMTTPKRSVLFNSDILPEEEPYY